MSRVLRQDQWSNRVERKKALIRGRIARWRGVKSGERFGLGHNVRIHYPAWLEVGEDVSIEAFSYLFCLSVGGVQIGQGTSIDRNLWLHCGGKPDHYGPGYFTIGKRSYIGCNAVIGAGGGICIGDNVLIGQSVNFHAENHIFADRGRLIREQGVEFQGIVVEDDVWIGSKVTILDGVTVGRGSVIAAGAVVSRSIPEYSVAAGVPAKVIKVR